MVFCSECENLLYPTLAENNELRWLCRACHHDERHDDIRLVYQINMRKEVTGGVGGELDENVKKMLAKFAHDPTVTRSTTERCPKCHEVKLAFFINPLEQPLHDMSLFCACANCSHVYKMRRKEVQQAGS
jgi:DNA-directed RNA polymerase subunit M/transcription elongation factor TFIIS